VSEDSTSAQGEDITRRTALEEEHRAAAAPPDPICQRPDRQTGQRGVQQSARSALSALSARCGAQMAVAARGRNTPSSTEVKPGAPPARQ